MLDKHCQLIHTQPYPPPSPPSPPQGFILPQAILETHYVAQTELELVTVILSQPQHLCLSVVSRLSSWKIRPVIFMLEPQRPST